MCLLRINFCFVVFSSKKKAHNVICMATQGRSLIEADCYGLSHARMKSKTKSSSEPVSHFLFVALSSLNNRFTHRYQVNRSEL